MASILRQRRGTAAEWAAANPVIPDGQLVFDTTNKLFKIGNGIATYSNLPAQSGIPGSGQIWNYRYEYTNQTAVNMDWIWADTSGNSVQRDTVTITVLDSTTYTVTINGIDFSYTSGVGATLNEIIEGLVLEINVTQTNGFVPVTAENFITDLRLTADESGTPFTATVGANLSIATSSFNSGTFTITLPNNPASGWKVAVADAKGTWASTNLIVAPDGTDTIMGLAESMTMDSNNVTAVFTYTGFDWRVSK